MRIHMSEDVYGKLEQIAGMAGLSPEHIVDMLTREYVSGYCNRFGEFKPEKALLLSVPDPEGKQHEKGPCYVLDKVSVMGMPYLKVFFAGRLIKAPVNCVVMNDDMDEKGEFD